MANLLFQINKKNIVYNFRKNDLKNGGEGAPLTPIFHKLLVKKKKIIFTCLYFKYWRNIKYNHC